MQPADLRGADDPQVLADYLERQAAANQGAHQHEMPMESIREASYLGHQILIRTMYRIEIDGQVVHGHLTVTNDGRVHYHGVPTQSFQSAVDLARRIIDLFPDQLADAPQPEEPHHHHPEH
jgi:hypothetical protein